MRLKVSSLSGLVTAALLSSLVNIPAAGRSAPPARIIHAAPGTNTLILARNAVRAWRATGHTREPAVVSLSPGDYVLTEPLALEAQDGNTTWVAREPEKTLVSGGCRITGFTVDTNGNWHTRPGFCFEQLYIHGRRAREARQPVKGFFRMTTAQEKNLTGTRARITAKVPDAAITALRFCPNAAHAVQLLVFHKWDTSRYAVSSFDPTAKTITVEGERMKPWNPWNSQSRFILENCGSAKTLEPGTWFLDPQGGLNYCPRPGEQIHKSDFIAPVVKQFMKIHGATNLHFRGLRFQYAGYQIPPEGCPPAQAASAISATIQIDDARNVTFNHCEIAHTGTYGIWFRRGCHDCRIEHCLLEDLGAGGVRIGEMSIRNDAAEQTEEIVADNNIIRGCGRVHPSAVGVWIGQSANNRVTHNDISDTFYTGISVGWTWGYGRSLATNNFIGYNRIHRIGQGGLSDMGGIYTLGVSPGSVCAGNVIFDVRAHDYGGWGIYPDEGSTGWRIESNLVWHCTCVNPHGGGAFHQHYGATNLIANNIFAFSSGPPMQATRVEDHLSFILEHNVIVSTNAAFFTGPWDKIHFESRSNCFAYFGSPRKLFPNGDLAAWQKAGHEAGSIMANPEFRGTWPDVTLPQHSPAFAVGFKRFDSQAAGVYGDRTWKLRAQKMEPAFEPPFSF